VRDAHFLKHLWAPSNIVEFDDETSPGICLEDYYLACRAGGVDDNLFIIQLVPIYLADSSRASLDHLLRNVIDSSEDLRETFTGNIQGTYVWPDNHWDLKSC
jgi:hypothetical protein